MMRARWICLFTFLSLCLRISLSSGFDETYDVELTYTNYIEKCAQIREISPCSCFYHGTRLIWIKVTCRNMTSFDEVVTALRNKLDKSIQIHLYIQHSQLEDLAQKQFKEIQSDLELLWLQGNTMSKQLSVKSFEGLNSVRKLVLMDTKITQFPSTIFVHMPDIHSITIARASMKSLSPADFKTMKRLSVLIIKQCSLTYIEINAFPPTLKWINLNQNNITTLNNTLRNNRNLELLCLGRNRIDSLDGQLWYQPNEKNTKLMTLHIWSNRLTKLPESLRNCIRLTQLLAQSNNITNLDEILKNMHKIQELNIAENRINTLSTDEFKECVSLEILDMSFNEISNLNKSLKPLNILESLNLTYNRFTEFSIDEVAGLTNLTTLDLSFNSIMKFIGKTEKNIIFPETTIKNLILSYNRLETLEGSLAEIKHLTYLNLSHNNLHNLPTTFLDGMRELEVLDVSYNYLHTLNDISKAVLPSLGKLFAIFNEISELKRETETGFSAVCSMQLQFNKIEYLSPNFTDKNQCVNGPGINGTLYVDLYGNEVLCKPGIVKIINAIESKNDTKIVGSCLNLNKK